MKIRVISLDYDGCLHRSFDSDVIAENQKLLCYLKSESKRYDKTIAFLGSNRQSKKVDKSNSMQNKSSCFIPFLMVVKHLDVDIDLLLMADIYGNLPEGTSFFRAIDRKYRGSHADWIFDETKLTLLYAQIHKTAKQYSSETIEYHFFDDRSILNNGFSNDILDHLHGFFSKYPDVLPKNVTLCLHHYQGERIVSYSKIQGIGMIDKDYAQTVKEMAYLVTKKLPQYLWRGGVTGLNMGIPIDVARNLNPTQLTRDKRVKVSQMSVFTTPPSKTSEHQQALLSVCSIL